jgi:GAF domain-containing protein
LLATDLARQVTARHDLVDVLTTTLGGLRRLLTFAGGSIQLLDDDGWIRLAAADPAPTAEVLALRIPLGGSIGGRVILPERPVYLPDVLAEPTVAGAVGDDSASEYLRARLSPGGVRSYFGVPLLAEGRAIGLLQVDAPEPNAWDDADRLLLVTVAPIVAAAIQNGRAYARVAVLTAGRRRDAERHSLVERIVDSDVDSSLAALVALSEDIPLVREQVDALTGAIARIRGALGDVAALRESTEAMESDIDLRESDPTRT